MQVFADLFIALDLRDDALRQWLCSDREVRSYGNCYIAIEELCNGIIVLREKVSADNREGEIVLSMKCCEFGEGAFELAVDITEDDPISVLAREQGEFLDL